MLSRRHRCVRLVSLAGLRGATLVMYKAVELRSLVADIGEIVVEPTRCFIFDTLTPTVHDANLLMIDRTFVVS